MQIEYIGEHLLPGKLGHLFVILSFVGALLSCFSFYKASVSSPIDERSRNQWLLLARNSFILHTASIIAVFTTLYYIITQHLFEYHYAWAHSDKSLSPKYLLSCFWEGQQGSFLLWSFWHSVLGVVVILKAGKLESKAMVIVSFVQVLLATTVLGIYLPGGIQIGTSPFLLLRDQMQNAPIFQQANYLSMIQDGNGLNVLLQNYWMVIHPPILFLGFASTLIPFALMIAALWEGEFSYWIKPTLGWALFSGAVLGLGIMMGGAWAYESLNFGGFWAWDPVENASLVPWLLMVAAIHTLVIFRATGRSLMTTLVFFTLCYLGIWYSTFLTRTGVLGDTSVHAFTGEGKSLYWQLLIFIGSLMAIALITIIRRNKLIPRIKTEEALWTREFWMFIGSFILCISAIQISISTSIPVWAPLAKWISGKDIAPPVDVVAHYNNIQIWVAMFIAILSGASMFLKFKNTTLSTLSRKFAITIILALGLSVWVYFSQQIEGWQFILLLFCTSFTIISSAYYAFSVQKDIKKMGPTLSHFGFGVMLLGILITGRKQEIISLNTLGGILPIGETDMQKAIKESQENVMMYKDMAVAMSDYNATYRGDSVSSSDPRTFYLVDFERIDTASGKVLEKFRLQPDAFVNPKGQQGLSANPSSKHYWNKDIFTYVSSVSAKQQDNPIDSSGFKNFTLSPGDTIYLSKAFMVFNGFDTKTKPEGYTLKAGDISAAALLDVYTLEGKLNTLSPFMIINPEGVYTIPDTASASVGAIVKLSNIITESGKAELQIQEMDTHKEWIVLKAIVFPHINLVWGGTILMVLGFLLSMWRSITKKPAKANK